MGINILTSKVASTYAQAFIRHALKKLQLTNSTVDMYRLRKIFVDSPEFDSFLKNPFISRDEKQKLIDMSIKNYLGSEIYKFISLLIQRNRINILKEITEVYDDMIEKESGFIIINVRTPLELSSAQRKSLEKKLRYNAPVPDSNIYVREILDKSLRGGLIIEMGSKKIDYSIETKLRGLKDLLEIT